MINSGKQTKILLYSPPGGLWLRGEARCEQDLENATAYTVTAPTTLCYMGAIFQQNGLKVKIIDSPVEEITWDGFEAAIKAFRPDFAILNASVLNLFEDLKAVELIKKITPETVNCLILPYFNSIPLSKIPFSTFNQSDLLIVGEMEAVAFDLADFINEKRRFSEIRGVISVNKTSGTLEKHPSMPNIDNLDKLPFPARDLIKNELYCRPDVGRPMASIVDGRGCPSSCIYCLAPITTGKRVRKRSVNSVIAEMVECVEKYQIHDFLFRSDAFTIKKDWVIEFCNELKKLNLKVSWAANSKTISFDEEIAIAMKDAGCFLVEFGIESGSDKSLKLQKKGTTTEHAIRAVSFAKKAGLLVYGTVLMGFPWETLEDLRETRAFIQKLDLDFIEVHVVAPYQGTELYEMMVKDDLIESDSIGFDMVKNPAIKGTHFLTKAQLLAFRKRMLRKFYFRPWYVLRTLSRLTSFNQFLQYGKYGIKLLLRMFGSRG